MYIIVGLGNPGKEYAHTRHNVGFETIDILADRMGIEVEEKKHKGLCGKGILAGQKVILLKPQTYMNLSGESVRAAADFYKVDPEDILVIYDDIDLPAGEVRIRKSGGPGTHNGMRDIVGKLGTENFPRVRCGIGAPEHKGELISYVLQRLSGEKLELLQRTAEQAAQAAKIILQEGIHAAQQEYNKKAKHREEMSVKEE